MTDRQLVERHHRITNNNAIDLHVGKWLRLRRTLLGMSQEQLDAELNITASRSRNMSAAPTGSALRACGTWVRSSMFR